MKAEFLDEPELEFGHGGRHVDIRFGLMSFGPLDIGSPRRPRIFLWPSLGPVRPSMACPDGSRHPAMNSPPSAHHPPNSSPPLQGSTRPRPRKRQWPVT